LKLGDKFAPYGPFIYSGADWRDRKRTLTITDASGETRVAYEHNTSALLHPPEKIVSDLSRVLTLEPGDVIFSGTTKAFIIEAGETVKTEIEGFGVVENLIVQ
jgi:2-keto-4-pentenoate hydratase/2-oxohepta-3-ene-1,7-dioic acid hydratase in catechol pathway